MKNLEHTIKDVVNKIQLDELKKTSKKISKSEEKGKKEKAAISSDSALDAASLVPGPVGMAASAEIARRALAKGDYVGAALAAPGVIPGVGRATSALRVGSKVARYYGKGKAKEVAKKARTKPSPTKPDVLPPLRPEPQSPVPAPIKPAPKTKPQPAPVKPAPKPQTQPAPVKPAPKPQTQPAPVKPAPKTKPQPTRPSGKRKETPRIETKPETAKGPTADGGEPGKPTRNLRRRLPWWMLGLPSLTPAVGGGGGVGQVEPSLVKLYHASPAAPLNAETEITEPLIESRKVSKGTEARRKVEGVRRFKNKKSKTTLSKDNSRTPYEKQAIKNTLDI